MPEGDTIRRLAAKVEAEVGGQTVTWSTFRHPRLALLDLTGRTLIGAEPRGKHLFLHFDDGWAIHIHLLMDGRVRFAPASRPPPGEEWRRRFELVFGDEVRVTGVDIPLLHRIRSADVTAVVDHLGPDVCGQFDPAIFELACSRLASAGGDAGMPLAQALLDQRTVAGFGNIYAVEVPFIGAVSPFHPVGDISGLDQLVAIGVALIRTNAALGPQNTTGRRLAQADHHILDARTRRCPQCGTGVKRRSGDGASGGTPWRRRTAWCPTCQPDAAGSVVEVDTTRARKLLALHPARRLLTFSDEEPTTVTFSGPSEPVVVQR